MAERFIPVPYEQEWFRPAAVEGATEDVSRIPPDVWRKPFVTPGTLGPPAGGVFGEPARSDTVNNLPGHLYPPPDAFMYDLPLNRLPVAIAPGIGLVVVAWPLVPQGQLGIVRKFAAVVTAGAAADARLVTRINFAPCQPFPGVIGAIGTLEAPQETLIVIPAGGTFDVLVTNIGLAAVTVAVRTWGWVYNDERAKRW